MGPPLLKSKSTNYHAYPRHRDDGKNVSSIEVIDLLHSSDNDNPSPVPVNSDKSANLSRPSVMIDLSKDRADPIEHSDHGNNIVDLTRPSFHPRSPSSTISNQHKGSMITRQRQSLKSTDISLHNEGKSIDKDSLTCQICMDKIQQPAATDCGHVFCYVCILHAVTITSKCPLCRCSLTVKKIRKLYI